MSDRDTTVSKTGSFLLLAAIVVAAACAIVYELLIGSVSAYFLGNSVEQFSLTIGFFLFAMGLGSWASRLFRDNLLSRFIALEMWLGLVGGLSVPVLYLAYAHSDHYRYGMLSLVMVIGLLIGLEVPLLARILRGIGSLRTILSNVLSLDYLGSLFAALLFPYLLLPLLGSLHTSLAAGLINLLVGVGVLVSFRDHLSRRARLHLAVTGGFVGVVLTGVLVSADSLRDRWESSFYEDRIVFSEQSKYQKIVLTQWRDEIKLFLNGHLQFDSVDHHRYHESLVHPAMALSSSRRRVLIIGGGDGLAAREVLKYRDVERVELVDLDPAVTNLARRNLHMTNLNGNSLSHHKINVVNEDAFGYLQRSHEAFGVIVLDLPDPREDALGKLYSVSAYQLCRRHLEDGGIVVTQASSPYYVRQAYWSIASTMEAAGFVVTAYHVWVPSFGDWGFHLASVNPVDFESVQFIVPRRFLRSELLSGMVQFDPDSERIAADSNVLDKPKLSRYYRQDWSRW